MKRIAFVITGLGTGGAEHMLLKLLRHLDRDRWQPLVISLRDRGELGAEIERLGVELIEVGLPRPGAVAGLWRAARRLRSFAPNVVQGWMYHGNLFATLLAPRSATVFWSVRQTLFDLDNETSLTRRVIRLGACLSPRVQGIIYNSAQSVEQHCAAGYWRGAAILIANGFDLDVFKPDAAARAAFRRRWGVPEDALLVGMVARVHPMKNHENFFAAARRLHECMPKVRFALVGSGTDTPGFAERVARDGMNSVFYLLGRQDNLAAIYPAFDLATLTSSWGEGFPNVLGEAMATGLPCVATDVGACAETLGDERQVVSPDAPAALAAKWQSLLELPSDARAALGSANRERVFAEYSMQSVYGRYASVWDALPAAAEAKVS